MSHTTERLRIGDRVWARDASGDERLATIEYGPARDRDGVRGQFVKYWLVFDNQQSSNTVPWPAEDVRSASG